LTLAAALALLLLSAALGGRRSHIRKAVDEAGVNGQPRAFDDSGFGRYLNVGAYGCDQPIADYNGSCWDDITRDGIKLRAAYGVDGSGRCLRDYSSGDVAGKQDLRCENGDSLQHAQPRWGTDYFGVQEGCQGL
jgi:hypothetical protein